MVLICIIMVLNTSNVLDASIILALFRLVLDRSLQVRISLSMEDYILLQVGISVSGYVGVEIIQTLTIICRFRDAIIEGFETDTDKFNLEVIMFY